MRSCIALIMAFGLASSLGMALAAGAPVQQEESLPDGTDDVADGAAVFERWEETLRGDGAPVKNAKCVRAAMALAK